MDIDMSGAVAYHYGKFPPQNLIYDRFIGELLAATQALARYDQMLRGMHNSEILLAPLRNQEAVISSRMEGTISTIDEILQYEADHSGEADPSETKNVRSEVIETLLYRRALTHAQHALEQGYPISTSFLRTVHQQLLSFGRGARKSPGKFKLEQNYLADRGRKRILFVPISPEHLVPGLDQLVEFINSSPLPPLLRTALMHIEFEALHPFEDGNGRIGRMLITLLLWQYGTISAPHFYISGFLEVHKDEYIDRMRAVSANGAWDEWCKFFFTAVTRQAEANLEVAENIRNLYESMKAQFSDLLSSRWSIHALDYVFANPIFRNSSFAKQAGIPSATAMRFTRLLAERGLLKTVEESAGRKPALYAFEPLMELVRV